MIAFTLNGQVYESSSEAVEARLAGVEPEPIREHAVRIGGIWLPVKQAFEKAAGVQRAGFTSHTARRHLVALGFEVRGEIVERGQAASVPRPTSAQVISKVNASTGGEWHTEANVQAAAVTALAAAGWRILSVANTATKERGVDIVAALNCQTAGIEVKGFPSKNYADPARAGETKKTAPSTQAEHWYAQAVLAAMRLRFKEPTWRSVIALPDFSRYRDLYSQTSGSLAAAHIELCWIGANGTVAWP